MDWQHFRRQGKKLIGAAEHWATGGATDDSKADAEAFGISLPKTAEKPDAFEVWPENWAIVMMWCRVATQWRVSMAGPVGLDYGIFPWLFKLYQVEDEREMIEGLQVMEQAYLGCIAKEAG